MEGISERSFPECNDYANSAIVSTWRSSLKGPSSGFATQRRRVARNARQPCVTVASYTETCRTSPACTAPIAFNVSGINGRRSSKALLDACNTITLREARERFCWNSRLWSLVRKMLNRSHRRPRAIRHSSSRPNPVSEPSSRRGRATRPRVGAEVARQAERARSAKTSWAASSAATACSRVTEGKASRNSSKSWPRSR